MSEEKRFLGLCVGGPMNGRFLEHYSPRYFVQVFEPLSAYDPTTPIDLHAMITPGQYRHSPSDNWEWQAP